MLLFLLEKKKTCQLCRKKAKMNKSNHARGKKTGTVNTGEGRRKGREKRKRKPALFYLFLLYISIVPV